jgi:chemotaxis protein MotB
MNIETATPTLQRKRIKRAKRLAAESHDDGDGNWLVSYADLMTLLFGFFVMLSAFSTPDAAKLEKLKEATSESMGTTYTKPYADLEKDVQSIVKDIKLDKEIAITQDSEGIKITSKGTLFFESGSATLKDTALTLMENLAVILAQKAKGYRIIVEGHTDDSPIATKQFPSNWELSSARAGSVVRLLESKGIPSETLRPVGLAHTEPVLPNRSPAGAALPQNQAENRRIVIQISRHFSRSKGVGL